MGTEVINVNLAGANVSAERGAEALRQGGLVGFATETVYGLAATATDSKAMGRLRDLKNRPEMPFSVHMGEAEDVGRYVSRIPAGAQRIIAKGWPGPVTLLLSTGGRLAEDALQKAGLHQVLCHADTIGLRCPRPEMTRRMLSAVEAPVVAASANPAGEPSPRDAQAVLEYFDGRIDLLLDSGPTELGADSTIVKFEGDRWQLVRKGALDRETIEGMLLRRLLFVCTGNTCRSPMAEGIARSLLSKASGVRPNHLAKAGWSVSSAGLWAAAGGKATPEAIDAAKRHGADITAHRSQKLTSELINSADLVLCMTDFHVNTTRQLAEGANVEVCRLDLHADIPDPIAGGMGVYRRTAGRIEKVLKERLDKGML